MEPITIIKYQCEICKHLYKTKEDAFGCEEKPISQDTGVKIGDTVLITDGEGSGEKAKVESRWVVDKHWGHYAWDKYWHTVAIGAAVDSGGNRLLTFDSYKLEHH